MAHLRIFVLGALAMAGLLLLPAAYLLGSSSHLARQAPQSLSLLQHGETAVRGASGVGGGANATDLEASMQAIMRLHALEADHQMALLQGRLSAINASTFGLLSALQTLHYKAAQILQKYDKDAPSSSAEPAPTLDQPMLNSTLRPGEIRTRGMTGYDCLTPLDNRRVILYPCHGGIDQVWRWSATGQLVGYRHACLDVTDLVDGAELRTRPCRNGVKGQQFSSTGDGIWMPTSEIRSKLYDGQCVTFPINGYRFNDTKFVHLEPCKGNCNQIWLINAINPDKSLPVSSFPKPHFDPAKKDSSKSGRVFCWVMTSPPNHAHRGVAVRDTWGRYCDYLFFATTKADPSLGNTILTDLQGEGEDRKMLWRKSKLVWMHVYHKYINQAEWFIRADDDTYFHMDNLRTYLATMPNPRTRPYFLGRKFVSLENVDFYGGGSGTVMSREALARLGKAADDDLEDKILANYDTFADDVEIGAAMARVGIETVDTRDVGGRHRFLGIGIDSERTAFRSTHPDYWLWTYSKDAQEGLECCSPSYVSSHYAWPDTMRYLDDAHEQGCEGRGRDPI